MWTEGICGDGAAILKDGVMVPIEEFVAELNRLEAIKEIVNDYYAALDRREHGGLANYKALEQIKKTLGMERIQGASLP